MKNWKIWTALLAVFILGATAGVFGTGMYLKHRFHSHGDPAAFHEKMRQRILNRIMDRIEPAPENRKAVKQAILATINEAEQLRMEVDPKLKEIFKRGQNRVRELLAPDARKRFDLMVEEFDRRRGDRPFPPPPPPLF